MSSSSPEQSILYTGDAKGADYEFLVNGLISKNTKVCIMSVNSNFRYNHKGDPTSSSEVIDVKDKERTKKAQEVLEMATKKLGRNPPGPEKVYVKRLLVRNYFQIERSNAVYAVGQFDMTGLKGSVQIAGGTAYACQMFSDKLLKDEITEERLIPLFFFSQSKDKWFQCKHEVGGGIGWKDIEKPAKPKGKYTGIGSRELDENGKKAIISLFVS